MIGNDDDKVISPSFSGGEVRIGDHIIDGDKELIAKETAQPHPWIAATSHPRPPSEQRSLPPDRFELEVKRDDKTVAKARCADMATLLDLNRQFEGIGYHFVKLERLGEDGSKDADE